MVTRAKAVIFDRDGTLASLHNAPITRDSGSWAAYNAAMVFDAPVPVVVALLNSIQPDIRRIMVSGRMEGDHPGDRSRNFRMWDWIAKHNLPIDLLFMRSGGDTRLDSVVKEEILVNYILPFYEPVFAVDDRPAVCDVWRKYDIPVLQVVDPKIPPPIGEKTGGDRRNLDVGSFSKRQHNGSVFKNAL